MNEWRDVLILLNIASMIGGAFYLVGMLRRQLMENTEAVIELREWLEREGERVRQTQIQIAELRAELRRGT